MKTKQPGKEAQQDRAAPPSSSSKTILLVAADDRARSILRLFLSTFGFVIDKFASVDEALWIFDPRIHDLVLIHDSTPGMTVEEMAHIIKMRSRNTPVLLYSKQPPTDRSCLDLVIDGPDALPVLKEGIDSLLAAKLQVIAPNVNNSKNV